ncbi:P-loop containing nucleoside triphosphate hydrolase protein [Sanghuangporus baumii]|uniref:Midasin n=1 Tax=Sanghuangporus baumii TaxID=108892 RepID=A0A9Q5HXE4_SANBA|nr:P-loop containing nucleoside triphosphate hydrolase protein [Sanghuangporus baumii]
MDLCARWLDSDGDTWEKLGALGLLIEIHEEIFSILSAFLCRFERGPLYAFLKEKENQERDRTSLHRVLLAYYRILRATPTLPRSLNWNLECLLRLCALPNLDRGARWLAIRCYSLQTRMSERIRIRMEQDALGELYDEDCGIVCGEDISGNVEEVDGWILPALESRRIQDYRDNLLDSSVYFEDGEKSDISLTEASLSHHIANIHGILLFRSQPYESSSSSLVLTSPALLTLRQLAVNFSLRRPTLLTSDPSSGKTTLIHHLSALIHPLSPNNVVTIHLADTSLDPRSLIGSYVSSTTSVGTFEWKDGVLVKAMREGRWVVLKDIDRASNEVLCLISPLAESLDDIKPIGSNAFLSLGNRGNVEAAETFALFATRSVEGNSPSDFFPPSFLGAQKWREIQMLENSLDDLRLLVDSKFPNIAGSITDGLIDIWLTVKHLRVVSSTRTVGIRDLEKFCARVSQFLRSTNDVSAPQRESEGTKPPMITLFPHPSTREEIYLDARDVFFAAGATSKPASEQRYNIAFTISEKLGLSERTCEWLLKRRSPAFEIERDVDGRPVAVRAGRTLLKVKPTHHQLDSPSARPFSMHKQALRLISQIATCVAAVEPVLLTGETGTGKTSVISHLAFLLNKPLVSLNLSNQTESSDLIGGFRPVSARVSVLELQQRFLELFQGTFSVKKNEKLLQNLRKAITNAKWKTVVKLWSETTTTAVNKLSERDDTSQASHLDKANDGLESSAPRKRRKLQSEKFKSTVTDWTTFLRDVREFEVQNILDKNKFSFHFVEGPLVKAVRSGSWVLLDEVNLASPETLECIASLLQGPSSSITLTEQGSLEPVPRHPDFRLFACMNPATDVGKKDLSNNIRARFTEIEVAPPDDDQEALVSVIDHYIGHLAVTDKAVISGIAELYTSVKQLAASGKIADGSNHRPHFSMRSLSRALTFTADTVQNFGLRRALWEGFTMSFTMILDKRSAEIILDLARRTLLSNVKNKVHFLTSHPPPPQHVSPDSYIQMGPFWLSSGPLEREEVSDYILTPSVQKKLMDLARIVITKRYAVLIEGPTSSGKTSAIQYLARRTGHNFVRINNHEHTDIQEYLGSYISDSRSGKLVFHDGLLVRALRRGDWIVLDELNLAPTDVLEALNRLLDDNRELIIPETQEIVRPHPNFMLFATQNPPGVYAGRKVLSRALRNRFLEVHFEDVPATELEHILSQRSRIAPSYAHRIVSVFQELQKRRQIGRIFEGKEGFVTLRDLFRWADRDAQGYQELAEAGYMLLAERTRRDEDKLVVKDVIEKVMNVSISEDSLYNMDKLGQAGQYHSSIVWTRSMRRLFMLLSHALRHKEPVLLVGETGTGKTSVCQLYAEIDKKVLRSVNCQQNTEAADIIGGLRPVRRDASLDQTFVQEVSRILGLVAEQDQKDKDQLVRMISRSLQDVSNPSDRDTLICAERALSINRGLLAWQDGPLVTSMRYGDVFLLDEISLADDSVLERLNSVLEPGRSIVLAEKGGDASEDFEITASPGFKFVATMNPGGDFGKKELSPALRNRFTEIWVPSVMNHDELAEIVNLSWGHDELARLTEPMLQFVDWLVAEVKDCTVVTLRDILSWVTFCNTLFRSNTLSAEALFVQGGEMALLDGLYSVTQLSGWSLESLRDFLLRARCRLAEFGFSHVASIDSPLDISAEGGKLQIGNFSIPFGFRPSQLNTFSFKAPTSLQNGFRLLRACQISKPVLLEGSPGVGKTSLVAALAAAAGQKLCRINLSEQTDLVDLFGSDLPINGDSSDAFAWRDAEFLRALKEGDWVLLDEMNLASQSVLEGLNAVFDHRGTVYIPEINRSFPRHHNFRVFAAQNPLNQGNGRKGLPKSFLNRFTKVYIEQLSSNDLLLICQHLFPTIENPILERMINLNSRLQEEVVVKRRFGISGAPWEFNLRDLIRWASLMTQPDGSHEEPWRYVNIIYGCRFRTMADRTVLFELCAEVFDDADTVKKVRPALIHTPELVICGNSLFRKGLVAGVCSAPRLLSPQTDNVDSALSSLSQKWLVIITGPHLSGKTTFARALAAACGRSLEEISFGSSTDTSDLIGSFEQNSIDFRAEHLLNDVLQIIDTAAARACLKSTGSLSLLLRLKDEVLTAQQTCSLAPLQDFARSSLSAPILDTAEPELQTVLTAISSLPMDAKQSNPTFEWVDGPLIRAMRRGKWMLLDNANLCSPAVLDRLNSLCESNGSLVLTEKGMDQEVVYPHPDFRLIMSIDPLRGDISRAMRNRGIEIALDLLESEDTMTLQRAAKRLALHGFCSTPDFDLSRRALCSASRVPRREEFVSVIHDDSVSSEIMAVEALYRRLDSSYDIAIALFAFSYSTPHNSKAMVRMFKSFTGPRTIAIREQLSLSLQDSANLRSMLAHPDISRDKNVQYRPLNPLLAFPFVTCLSGDELKCACLAILIIEASFMASRLELQLRKEIASSNGLLQGNTDHVHIFNFMEAIPLLVRQLISAGQANIYDLLVGFMIACARDTILTPVKPNIEAALDIVYYALHLHQAVVQAAVDFSALYAASGWIHQRLSATSDHFNEIRKLGQTLHETYALTSGMKVEEIWASFYRPCMPTRMRNLFSLLETMPQDTRKRAADLIAVVCARKGDADDAERNISLIRRSIDENSFSLSSDEGILQQLVLRESSQAILISEMNELADLTPYSDTSDSRRRINSLRRQISQIVRVPRRVAYQLLLWKMEARLDILPELVNAHLEWHRSFWDDVKSLQNSGPSIAFSPVFLQAAITASANAGGLGNIDLRLALLGDQTKLILSESSQVQNRKSLAVSFLLRNIELVIRAGFPDIAASLPGDIAHVSEQASVFPMLEALQYTALEPFKPLIPALETIARSSSWVDLIQSMGRCWILLSQVLLSLYVPSIPIDPLAVRSSQKSFIESRIGLLKTQIRVYSLWEHNRSGHRENALTDFLRSRSQSLQDNFDSERAEYSVTRQSDSSLLQAFWNETRGFCREIASPERLEQFVLGAAEAKGDVAGQESLLQDSISNYVQRMKSAYSTIEDLVLPIELSMMQLRFGLSTLRHSARLRRTKSIDLRTCKILGFPSVQAMHTTLHSTSEDLVVVGFKLADTLLLRILATPQLYSREAAEERVVAIQDSYEQIMSMFDAYLNEKKEKARQAESLYRSRQTTHVTLDDDSEEEQIRQLFPVFSDEDREVVLDSIATEQPSTDVTSALSNEFARKLLNVHLLLFCRDDGCSRREYGELWHSTLLDAVTHWKLGQLSSLPCSADDDSYALRFNILLDAKLRFQRIDGRAYSFYRDANLHEARKAANIVKSLRDKLRALIRLWPDQLVLQHLQDRCNSILSISMTGSVARILGAVESLLLHTEDWEMFANHENSLMKQRQSLTDLIVEWRRLELNGWKSILDVEAKEFCAEVSDWWFRMYDVAVRGAIAVSQDAESDALTRYLDSLTLLVEDFIRTSPLGQYIDRLELILSFASFTSALTSTGLSSRGVMSRVSLVLVGIHHYYRQFADKVSASLLEGRAAIEKDVQNLVKLATWKDVNVHALQQSALRTHRQLYKRIRQFRELLRRPAIPHLQIDDSQLDVSAEDNENEADTIDDLRWHALEKGPPRSRKFASLFSNGLKHILDPSSTLSTEDLSRSIISIQSEYANAQPSRDLSPSDRKKWNSALFVRKKRSWNDFLKELKRIGFSPNVRHEITEALRSKRYVMEQPTIDAFEETPFRAVLSKINYYFYRCVGLLRTLLQCDIDHHSDVSTREIQRGVSSFESAFFFAISARITISGLTSNWISIRSLYRKFCELEHSRSKGIIASAVRDVVRNVAIKTREAIDALQELIDVANKLSILSDDVSPIDTEALIGVHDWMSKGTEFSKQLSALSKASENGCIITEDNYDQIRMTMNHLRSLRILLTSVSEQEPSLMRFCVSTCDWLDETLLAIRIPDDIENVGPIKSDATTDMNTIIDLLLLVGQDLRKIDELAKMQNIDDSGYLRRQHSMFLHVSQILRADSVVDHLRQLSEDLSGLQPPETSEILCQILPFISSYLAFTERHLSGFSSWTKSLLKLTYISGSLLRNIATKGFCRPSEFEDTGDAQEGAIQLAEGTGLGQGEGEEDVSSQIEDESQFEGIKGEDGEANGNSEGGGKDEAIDVDFDLSGQFEDGHDQDSRSEEEESVPDLDDEFGNNISDNLDDVDKDFWDEEADDERLSNQLNGDSTATDGRPEMVAKEQESIEDERRNDQTREELQTGEDDGVEAAESHAKDEKGDNVQPAEEDTQMTDGTAEGQTEESSMEPAFPEQQESTDDLDDLRDSDQEKEPAQLEANSSEATADAEVEDESKDQDDAGSASKADVHAGGKDGNENTGIEDASVASEGMAQKSGEVTAEPPVVNDVESEDASFANSIAQMPEQTKFSSSTTGDTHPSLHGAESSKRLMSEEPLPNPHRSLGDAQREVKRRFDEILDTTDAHLRETVAAEQSVIEYAPDESTEGDMQALGPALDEETAKLNKLSLIEEQDRLLNSISQNDLPDHGTDHQDQVETTSGQEHLDDGELRNHQNPDDRKEMNSKEADSQPMDIDGVDQSKAHLQKLSSEERDLSQTKKVEAELDNWFCNDQPRQDAQRIWQLYDALTQDLSFSLCEQLRLILEPTRATRLMGDFRTGKRLNMKKIIPYIASNYTKDKIWLRRVRPSQREYQVLIALDDSRSMAETHSIHLAFQTLALVSKALNRLEVGDVAVASFGERMYMVHRFEDGPFTEQAGTKVLETFKFAQTATDVRPLLDSSVEVLTKARERRISSSSSDLWQLEIIISDGICQNHEELRAILRKAEEEHILIVFIIIDAHHSQGTQHSADDTSQSQNSIVNMTQAMYRTVNGRLELHMQRYLDSFPFEFFVILKDVETLPDVLADTLRQFFERISAS